MPRSSVAVCLLGTPLIAWAAVSGAASADTLGEQQRALTLIADTADRICSVVRDRGEALSAEVQGEVQAQLSGLASRLARAGVNGTGNISGERYAGVLRGELASTLKNNADCKLQVFRSLEARLVPAQQPRPAAQPLPAQGERQVRQPASEVAATPMRQPQPPFYEASKQECAEDGPLQVCALSVAAAPAAAGRTLTVILRIRNTGGEAMGVALVGPPPNAVASDGTALKFDVRGVGGLGVCFNISPEVAHNCLDPKTGYLPPGKYTRIAPGGLANASFRFEGGPSADASILAFQAALAVRFLGAERERGEQVPATFTVGLSDLPVSKPR